MTERELDVARSAGRLLAQTVIYQVQLVRAVCPWLTNAELAQLLRETADFYEDKPINFRLTLEPHARPQHDIRGAEAQLTDPPDPVLNDQAEHEPD